MPPPPRRSFLALHGAKKGGTKQFYFRERDRAYCQRWRAALDHPDNKAFMDEYGQWLSTTGRRDGLTNRFLFFGEKQRAGK